MAVVAVVVGVRISEVVLREKTVTPVEARADRPVHIQVVWEYMREVITVEIIMRQIERLRGVAVVRAVPVEMQ